VLLMTQEPHNAVRNLESRHYALEKCLSVLERSLYPWARLRGLLATNSNLSLNFGIPRLRQHEMRSPSTPLATKQTASGFCL